MKLKADTTGCDLASKKAEDAYYKELVEIGRRGISKQRDVHDYKNRTQNLERATGFCVIRDGRVVALETVGGGEAASLTEATLRRGATHDGLWFGNGMSYASYVQSKGYDVQDTAILLAMGEVRGG